jgi:UDP-3-O-[3-hydroxymyristoyl] glucosamine N-acyltransferase
MVDTRFHPSTGPTSLRGLLAATGHERLQPEAGGDVIVEGADELDTAGSGQLALAIGKQYVAALKATGAGIVLVHPDYAKHVPEHAVSVVADNTHDVFVDLLEYLYPGEERRQARELATAADVPPALEENVTVHPSAILGSGVEIGRGTIIGPNAVIGAHVTIGRDCIIGPNTTIECAHLGDRVLIKSGARIGLTGFGWLDLAKSNRKIPQLGRTILQDDVEIGANTAVDRGALGDTVIGAGTKIDNLVQIGHNCRIGRNCLIAGMCGLAGSTILEDSVLMGGGSGTQGHLTIGRGTRVMGRSAVTDSWPADSYLVGAPAKDAYEYGSEALALRRLLRDRKK